MKIAIDARIISSTTGRYVERLIHFLEQIDNENEYFILLRQKDSDYYKPANPNFKIVIAEFADYSFGEQLGFATLLQKLKPDLVHFCMPQQPLLYTRPAITTIHDLNLLRITQNDMGRVELAIKKQLFRVMLYIVAKRTKHVITPTKYTKHDLLQFAHINPGKITVTYEGSLEKMSRLKQIEAYKDKDFIMYLGRAEPYKNNRGIIKAHQSLLEKHPNLRLVIAGKIDKLRSNDIKWVRDNSFKNVDFIGYISDEEAAWMYSNCRFYVIASFMEGFGLPALDAMVYGAPILSSNLTCLPEVYQDAAHYFNPNDPGAMAKAMDDVLSDKKLRDNLKKKSLAQYKKYSWQKMAKQTLDIYNSVLKSK